MKKKKIFLLDAMALIYKYYFVFLSRPLVTSKGETVGAIYGFLNFVFSILEKEKPDYIAVAFDNKEPTFRHKLFPEYKATRQKIPEDLIPQTEKIKDIVKCLNITLLEFPGYEADDIIGTLAKNISLKGVDVFCVTSDKDYFQLIDHNIKIYKPGKTSNDVEIITENEVKEKYNLSVNQLIDFFALMGDPTDNIPGVPGVGEKTALSLLQEWGSLDNIYNNLEKINKKSIYEKLKSNKELAYLSRELVKINVNVPLKIDLSELELKDYDTEKLSNYFKELEFKSLEKRLTPDIKENINPNNFENNDDKLKEENINSIKKNYHLVKNLNEIDKIVQDIIKKKFFSYDLETTSIEPLNAEIVGIAISFEEKTGYYIPVLVENLPETNVISLNFTPQKKDENLLPVHTVLEKLKCILEDEKIKKIGQNIKYDMLVTSRYGITIKGIGFDSMVASYILDPDSQHNLEALAKRYLNYKMIPISDLIGSGKNQKNMKDIDINLVSNYACEDADIALRLKPILEKEILRNEYYTRPSCALLSLPDFHLDKLTLDKVSIQQKIDNYKAVLQSLLYRAYKSHLIEEIVFVIGNDYFHTDTINNTTTKGTPLEVATSWNEAYELGFNLLVESITKLRQFCSTLHIILVQGNHPRTKEYFLAHALEVYFKKDSNIIFNRSTENLKVHSYGETLMCFSHGDNINDKLPLSFATTFYKEWGECKYKEIILGDKHHNSEKLFKTQGEAQGVRMRILPSLTGVDRWHKDNLFINSIQSGICLVYDKERGKISEFEERI